MTDNPLTQTITFFSNATPTGTTTYNDNNPVVLGIDFFTIVPGTITGVRFYNGHAGSQVDSIGLFYGDSSQLGVLIHKEAVTNSLAVGWQTIPFATPQFISANVDYMSTYHTKTYYVAGPSNSFDPFFVDTGVIVPSANNQRYGYGDVSYAPDGSYNDSNYYVDVVFEAAPLSWDLDWQSPYANDYLFSNNDTTITNSSDSDMISIPVVDYQGNNLNTTVYFETQLQTTNGSLSIASSSHTARVTVSGTNANLVIVDSSNSVINSHSYAVGNTNVVGLRMSSSNSVFGICLNGDTWYEAGDSGPYSINLSMKTGSKATLRLTQNSSTYSVSGYPYPDGTTTGPVFTSANGSSTGAGSAIGIISAIEAGTGASAGTGGSSATGRSTDSVSGQSAGSSSASSLGTIIESASGASNGLSDATGGTAVVFSSAGSAPSSSTISGWGTGIASAEGVSGATSEVASVSISFAGVAGTASGSAGGGAEATGIAYGVGEASGGVSSGGRGFALDVTIGTGSGTSSTSAVSNTIRWADGSSSASSGSTGQTSGIFSSVGSASSSSVAEGDAGSQAFSSGLASVSGEISSIASAVGLATAGSDGNAYTFGIGQSYGESDGGSVATAVSFSICSADGIAVGTGTVFAPGVRIETIIGSGNGTSAVSGSGVILAPSGIGDGSSTGTGSASAISAIVHNGTGDCSAASSAIAPLTGITSSRGISSGNSTSSAWNDSIVPIIAETVGQSYSFPICHSEGHGIGSARGSSGGLSSADTVSAYLNPATALARGTVIVAGVGDRDAILLGAGRSIASATALAVSTLDVVLDMTGESHGSSSSSASGKTIKYTDKTREIMVIEGRARMMGMAGYARRNR